MAFELPRRNASRQIEVQQRKIPLQEILAVQGQNPLATGIETAGNVLGKAIAKRAEAQETGRKLAALAQMAGQPAPDANSELSPELYEKGLSYKTAADAKRSERAQKAAELQLQIEKLSTDHTEYDPTTGKTTVFQGKRGIKVGTDQYGDPRIDYGADYNQGTIPTKVGNSSGANQDNKLWYQLTKESNPTTASSRSVLGMAATGTAKAQRADAVLARPDATPQDIAAAVKDLGSIFQGGAPTDSGTHELEYNTLATKWANLQTLVTSNPAAVNSPQIKQHMRDIIKELNDVNQRTINDNFDYQELAHPELIASHRKAWDAIRGKARASSLRPISTNGPQPIQGTLSPAAQALIDKHRGQP